MKSQISCDFNYDSYNLSSSVRSNCLIVNNVNFDNDSLPKRTYSDFDASDLRTHFQRLKMNVIMKRDLKAKEIIEVLDSIRTNDALASQDLFILVILSHGNEYSIYGSDGNEVDVDDIKFMFDDNNCPQLKGKPKLFFFEFSRGDMKDKGVDPNVNYFQPIKYIKRRERRRPAKRYICSDMLISYSTVFGYVSNFDENGSFYCRALIDVLKDCENKEICDILRAVDREVSKKETKDGLLQTTQFECIGFTKYLFLQ